MTPKTQTSEKDGGGGSSFDFNKFFSTLTTGANKAASDYFGYEMTLNKAQQANLAKQRAAIRPVSSNTTTYEIIGGILILGLLAFALTGKEKKT